MLAVISSNVKNWGSNKWVIDFFSRKIGEEGHTFFDEKVRWSSEEKWPLPISAGRP